MTVRIGFIGLHGLHDVLSNAAKSAKVKVRGSRFEDLSRVIPKDTFRTDGVAPKAPINEAAQKLRELLRSTYNAVVVIGNGHEAGYLMHALKMPVDVIDSHVDGAGEPYTLNAINVFYGDHLTHSVGDNHQKPESITFYAGRAPVEGREFLEDHLRGVVMKPHSELKKRDSKVVDADTDAFTTDDGFESSYGTGNCRFEDLIYSFTKNPPSAVGLFEIPRPDAYAFKHDGIKHPKMLETRLERLLTALAQAHEKKA